MRTFLLQDWVTIRGGSTPFSVSQDPSKWLDLSGYSDVTCWLDVTEVTPPNGTSTNSVQISLQTAPTADEAYFTPIAPALGFGTTSQFQQASPTPRVVRSGRTPLGANLSRYLRWQITPFGGGVWDLSFRIRAIANRSTAFTPALIPNLQAWFRPDLGVTVGASPLKVMAWNDQSGTNDANKNLTSGSSTAGPILNFSDPLYLGQPTMTVGSDVHNYFANSAAWTNTVAQPHTLVLVGHRTSTPANSTYFIDGNGVDATTACTVFLDSGNHIVMGGGAFVTTTGTFPWTTPSALLLENNGSATKGYFNNFTTALPTTGTGGTAGFRGMSLGVHSIGFGGGLVWPGTIVELIDYGALLTVRQKAQLRNYLNGRYGLTIT